MSAENEVYPIDFVREGWSSINNVPDDYKAGFPSLELQRVENNDGSHTYELVLFAHMSLEDIQKMVVVVDDRGMSHRITDNQPT